MTVWLIAGVVTLILALFGVIWAALRVGAKADVRADRAEAYRKTRERIDYATQNLDRLSDGDVDERLRRHADQ